MTSYAGAEAVLAFLAVCFIKVSILLLLAWMVISALRKESAALRHMVWAAAIAASMALPVCTLILPAWHNTTLGNAAGLWSAPQGSFLSAVPQFVPSTIIQVSASSSFLRDWPLLVLLLWAFGFIAVAIRLIAGLSRLIWVSARATPLFDDVWMNDVLTLSRAFGIRRSVRILECGNLLTMPLTWGATKPVIVLPVKAQEWTAERRGLVLAHELAHIARHDWLWQICGELARCFHWFNPFFWLAAARLRQESELACDDAVLRSGFAPRDYASQLLELARTLKNPGRAWSTALAIARPTNLERRFAAMMNPSLNRRNVSTGMKWFVPLLALALLLPLAALRLSAQNLAGKTSGSIHDPSGAGIPNATIVMSNHAANTIDMTTTDRDGNFVFKALPAGSYEMQIFKPGFQTYAVPHVSLDAGKDFSETFTMGVGAITEHVMVVPDGSTKALPVEESNGKVSRIKVGGNVEASMLTTKVQPVYPQAAKDAGVSGTVILHAVISKDGMPLSLRVMNSEIDPDLARSAVEAVSKWRYTPTLLNGEPIEVDTTIDVNYTLQQ